MLKMNIANERYRKCFKVAYNSPCVESTSTERRLKPIVPKSSIAKQSVEQPLEDVEFSVTICHIIINYFFLVAFIISQNALEEGLCQSRVGLAHPHAHARRVFPSGFPQPDLLHFPACPPVISVR